jgi:hypothetical protein
MNRSEDQDLRHARRHRSDTPGRGTRPTGACRPRALTWRQFWGPASRASKEQAILEIVGEMSVLVAEKPE